MYFEILTCAGCLNRRKTEESKKACKRNKIEFHSFLANQKINKAEKTIGTSKNGRGNKKFSGERGRLKTKQKKQQNKNRA